MCEKKIIDLEEELRVVGQNLQQLEVMTVIVGIFSFRIVPLPHLGVHLKNICLGRFECTGPKGQIAALTDSWLDL